MPGACGVRHVAGARHVSKEIGLIRVDDAGSAVFNSSGPSTAAPLLHRGRMNLTKVSHAIDAVVAIVRPAKWPRYPRLPL